MDFTDINREYSNITFKVIKNGTIHFFYYYSTDTIHLYLYISLKDYEKFVSMPIDDMPLYINEEGPITSWRKPQLSWRALIARYRLKRGI